MTAAFQMPDVLDDEPAILSFPNSEPVSASAAEELASVASEEIANETSDDLDDSAELDDEAESASINDPDQPFWDKLQLLAKLREAELDRQQCQTNHDQQKEKLKLAKAKMKAAELEVFKLTAEVAKLNSLPEVEEKEDDDDEKAANQDDELDDDCDDCDCVSSGTATVSISSKQPSGSSASEGYTSDEWRAITTESIASKIKGVGKKKLEALTDLCPTLGDLEDLRSEGSKAFKQFREVLPDGWGEGKANELEDAMLAVLAKWIPRPGVGEKTANAEVEKTESPQTENSEPVQAVDTAEAEKADEAVESNEPSKRSVPDLSDL